MEKIKPRSAATSVRGPCLLPFNAAPDHSGQCGIDWKSGMTERVCSDHGTNLHEAKHCGPWDRAVGRHPDGPPTCACVDCDGATSIPVRSAACKGSLAPCIAAHQSMKDGNPVKAITPCRPAFSLIRMPARPTCSDHGTRSCPAIRSGNCHGTPASAAARNSNTSLAIASFAHRQAFLQNARCMWRISLRS